MKKKLMILGGSRYILPLIEKAHKMDIFVITCDYLPNNIAHKYSDMYVNISIIDKDAVLKKAQDLNIDGISSFACDPGVITAAYVAEKMHLPNVGPYESVLVLQNKTKFREFLRKNHFNVPFSKGYKCKSDVFKDLELFTMPVIVKPVDSAGSKGVTKVSGKEELDKAIDNAFSASFSGEIIIEEFLEKVGCSSDCDCYSINGEMKFFSFSSQIFDNRCVNPFVPSGVYWPATIEESQQAYIRNEISRLIKLLKMKTSIYNVECRQCVNGKSYIMEVSPRGGGNRLSEMVCLGTGVDLIDTHIRYCVGLDCGEMAQAPFSKKIVEIIVHSQKPGIFNHVNINPEFTKFLLEQDIWVNKGDSVGGFRGANEAIGTLVFEFEDLLTQKRFLDEINTNVKVIVDD